MRTEEITWYTPEEKLPDAEEIILFHTKLSMFPTCGYMTEDEEFWDFIFFYQPDEVLEWAYVEKKAVHEVE